MRRTPWSVDAVPYVGFDPDWIVVDAEQNVVIDCGNGEGAQALAQLIAAAPELLEAVEALRLLALDCWSRGHPAIVERAEAVIKKARGDP